MRLHVRVYSLTPTAVFISKTKEVTSYSLLTLNLMAYMSMPVWSSCDSKDRYLNHDSSYLPEVTASFPTSVTSLATELF